MCESVKSRPLAVHAKAALGEFLSRCPLRTHPLQLELAEAGTNEEFPCRSPNYRQLFSHVTRIMAARIMAARGMF